MKESELCLPLKRFLKSQEYEVKGQVLDRDVVAVRGKESPVVVGRLVMHFTDNRTFHD